MRDYDGWAKEDFERFKQWMIDVWFTTAQDFLERRHDTVTREGNWYHYHKIHQEKSLRHQDDKQMAVLRVQHRHLLVCASTVNGLRPVSALYYPDIIIFHSFPLQETTGEKRRG